eukprot:scaffold1121_cov317-Prasinococcus_capsulatus_cf.AAC.1
MRATHPPHACVDDAILSARSAPPGRGLKPLTLLPPAVVVVAGGRPARGAHLPPGDGWGARRTADVEGAAAAASR